MKAKELAVILKDDVKIKWISRSGKVLAVSKAVEMRDGTTNKLKYLGNVEVLSQSGFTQFTLDVDMREYHLFFNDTECTKEVVI